MDCLIEMFVGIFGEIFFEAFSHLFTSVYLKLAHVLAPGKRVSQKTEARIQKTVAVIFALLLLTLLFGVILFFGNAESNPTLHTVGLYMTFIPLGIFCFQILLGLFVLLWKVFKRNIP